MRTRRPRGTPSTWWPASRCRQTTSELAAATAPAAMACLAVSFGDTAV
jgi:hypothetical protein